MKKYRYLEVCNIGMCKEIRRLENKLVNFELANRSNDAKIMKFTKLLNAAGYNKQEIENIMHECDSDDNMSKEPIEETSRLVNHN